MFARLCLLFLLACSCASPLVRDGLRAGAQERELFGGWNSCTTIAFEERIADLAGAPPMSWSPAARAVLAGSLQGQDATAVRAVVLLAHDPSAAIEDVLLARLEERVKAPTRPADAGDLLAATALTGRGLERAVPARLAALAVGPEPHPDLEVRVECAVAALWSGRDEVAPFLIRVLRALTPAERDDPPDWEPVRTVAWAKTRAAEALSRRLGERPAFRPDGSWQHQMDEAARYAAAFDELPAR